MKRAWNSTNSDEITSDDSEDECIIMKEKMKILPVISDIMYTFGDVKEPLTESVEEMYSILREQMNILLIEAEAIASCRSNKEISHEEILFLVRKNKGKLKQLLQYISILDSKRSFIAAMNSIGKSSPSKNKNVKICMQFLSTIEDCKEYNSLLEDEMHTLPEYAKQRLQRRLAMIELMNAYEYEEFAKALQTSFCQNPVNFKSWLLKDQIINLAVTKLAVIMIGFLARETIAVVVDKALLIKSNKLKEKLNWNFPSNPFDLPESSTNVSEKEANIIYHIDSDDDVTDNGQNSLKSCTSKTTTSKLELNSNVSSSQEYLEKLQYADHQNTVLSNYVSSVQSKTPTYIQETTVLHCPLTENISDYENVLDATRITEEIQNNLHKQKATDIFIKKAESDWIAASKKEIICREAITAEEIREVFAQLNAPSSLFYFFSNHPTYKKKFFLLEP